MPRTMMMADAMSPMPGAAKAVVPKNGIGMALLIDGVPGMTDIVNVKAPPDAAVGSGKRGGERRSLVRLTLRPPGR